LFFLLQSIGLFKPEERHKRWARSWSFTASHALKSPLGKQGHTDPIGPTVYSTLTKQIYTLMTTRLSPPERPR
jgi:hypothetical protein